MQRVAFAGLGNMGLPMACNLRMRGYDVRGVDPSPEARAAAEAEGIACAESLAEAAEGAFALVSALPAARHVRALYLAESGRFSVSGSGLLCIDCSTIDVGTARDVAAAAARQGHAWLDSPMSGGVPGAKAGTLTFMAGGEDAAFAQARPILEAMGRNIFHAGGSGAGAAAKICNNMLLGVTMVGVAEAFNLAAGLGLSAEMLHRISSTSSGRCWSLNDYCPAPGPVPAAPSNKGYQAGFAGELMLKDLRLAMDVAREAGVATPLGANAAQIYGMMERVGMADLDFSAVIRFLAGEGRPDS